MLQIIRNRPRQHDTYSTSLAYDNWSLIKTLCPVSGAVALVLGFCLFNPI